MVKRTVTGIIIAGILFLALWLNNFSHFVLDALIFIFGIGASIEMIKALKGANTNIEDKNGYNVSGFSMLVACLLLYPASYYLGYVGLLFTLLISVIVAFIVYIFNSKRTFADFTANIFAIIYPLIMIGAVYCLHAKYGVIPVILAVGISTISDAMAYFVGASIGKKKIFPKISPKKTYAGCIGGLFGGALGGIIVYAIFELGKFPSNIQFTFGSIVSLPILLYAVLGFIIAFFSEIGDLAASRIKREVGIKDYGKALGAHGGFMDRIDSILFTTVCVAIIMQIIEWTVL